MCKKSKHDTGVRRQYFSKVAGDIKTRGKTWGVGGGEKLRRVFTPSQYTFVDPEHRSGVRHDPHQVCAESAIQGSRAFLSNYETECLNEPSIFFDTIDRRLSKPRPENLTGRVS